LRSKRLQGIIAGIMSARSFETLLWFVRGIAFAAFALSLALWVFCQEDRVMWSRTFDTRIRIQSGDIEWLSRHHYFWYTPWQLLSASFVLLVALFFYRYLRTTLGLMTLAVIVNVVVLNAWNDIANVLLFIFDVGCASLVPNRPLFRPAIVNPLICVKCGYDLRATPERCPECGTVVLLPGRSTL
jgi:hypothetical protein